jgi:hypothetical protein
MDLGMGCQRVLAAHSSRALVQTSSPTTTHGLELWTFNKAPAAFTHAQVKQLITGVSFAGNGKESVSHNLQL